MDGFANMAIRPFPEMVGNQFITMPVCHDDEGMKWMMAYGEEKTKLKSRFLCVDASRLLEKIIGARSIK